MYRIPTYRIFPAIKTQLPNKNGDQLVLKCCSCSQVIVSICKSNLGRKIIVCPNTFHVHQLPPPCLCGEVRPKISALQQRRDPKTCGGSIFLKVPPDDTRETSHPLKPHSRCGIRGLIVLITQSLCHPVFDWGAFFTSACHQLLLVHIAS